jgi:hypothetical protein
MENFTAVQDLARFILAHEQCDGKRSEATALMSVCVCVCDRLRRPLSVLAGVDGYKALLGRALALAKAKVPSLGPVQIEEDGCLAVPGHFEPQRDTDKINAEDVELVAQLLGLLVTFIGVALTMQLVRDVWPDAPYYGMETENKP